MASRISEFCAIAGYPTSSGASKWWTLLCAIFIALYCAMLVHLRSGPFQDNPNHLARAVAMADLIYNHGAEFGSIFHYQFRPIPYIAGDIILTTAVEILGPRAADALWITLAFVSLPAGLLFFLRAHRISVNGQILAVLLTLYLSTDWFFMMGFFEFRLAIAVTLTALGLVHLMRSRWSTGQYCVYCLVVLIGYLVHIAAPVFLTAAVATSGTLRLWRRTSSLRAEIGLMIPVVLVLAWHFGVAVDYDYGLSAGAASGQYEWSTVHGKFARLSWEFHRYSPRADWLMLFLCASCLALPVLNAMRRGAPKSHAILETAVLCLVFLGMYLVLPIGRGNATYVDVRPLAFIPLFLILGCLQFADAGRWSIKSAGGALALSLATVLAVANLAYLEKHLARDDAWMEQYRRVVAQVPRGARVMLVNTVGPQGRSFNPLEHVGEFVVIDRGAITADVFSFDTGAPMKYFRYIKRPYVPDDDEFWYRAWPRIPVDWAAIACDYDYLLATKPFDSARIRIAATVAAENSNAALLAIARSCNRPSV